MGKGLSELQKAILKLSWNELEELRKARLELDNDPALMADWKKYYTRRRWDAPIPKGLEVMAKDNWTGRVDINDILINFYGWTAKTHKSGLRYFSKSEIGPRQYMAAYIAVRKSLDRLESRGLIYRVPNGRYNAYSMTIEGRDLMAKLEQ